MLNCVCLLLILKISRARIFFFFEIIKGFLALALREGDGFGVLKFKNNGKIRNYFSACVTWTNLTLAVVSSLWMVFVFLFLPRQFK